MEDRCGGMSTVEIELQDGKLSGLKEDVKRNMFRECDSCLSFSIAEPQTAFRSLRM